MHVYKKIDAWEQCKLGDLGSVVMNRRIFKEETADKGDIPFYKIGTFGGEADSYITREKFEDYKLKYPYPETGDILISASGSIGRTVEYNGEEAYYQDSNIVWLKHDKQLYNLFLKQFYFIVKWSGVEGTTIKRLYNKNILDTEINIPSINEQKEIGGFFKQLDNTIALHQRKLDALKLMKQGFLQQMFPGKGEKVPRLRFADFEEEWEQHKLEEVLKVNSGRDYKHLNSGDIPVYGTGGYMLSVDDKISNVDGVGIGRKGTIDKPQYLKAPYWTVDTLFYMTVFEGNDLGFLYSLTKNINWKKMDESTGVPSLSKSAIKKVVKTFPPFEEQQKIGAFFKQLDDIIVFYQNKLNTLNNLKKSFLQNMFI